MQSNASSNPLPERPHYAEDEEGEDDELRALGFRKRELARRRMEEAARRGEEIDAAAAAEDVRGDAAVRSTFFVLLHMPAG